MKQRLLRMYYRILIAFAHHYLLRHKPKIIGINGSVGKTSCRMIIYQTLQQFFPTLKISTSPKNFNGELGLSLSVFEITERTPSIFCFRTTFWVSFFRCRFGKKRYDIIVLEYGIDRPGEMDFILKVAHPDMGIFTAIDAVHSEQFGNPAEIANEESKMALHTKELVFLNHDDSYAMQLSPRLQVDKLTYQTKGYGEKADISFRACDFLLGAEQHEIKSAFSLDIKGKAYNITTNLIGKANYGYIGVALAIVEILGYRSSWIEEKHKRNYNALSNTSETIDLTYTLQPGRLSIFAGKYESILFDSTYNASPQSVRSIIDTVITIRSHLFPQSEIWLILGDMRELGDLTEQEHRYLAGYVSQVADKLFLLGQSMQNYLADELEKVGFDQKKSYLAGSLKELNKQLEKELKKADKKIPLLVFKGSQNTIFLEESVKHFLLDNADEASLTRQGKFWEAKKKDYC